MQCGLVFFLLLLSEYLGISRRSLLFGIALGFGFFTSVSMLVTAGLSHQSLVHVSILRWINWQLGYLLRGCPDPAGIYRTGAIASRRPRRDAIQRLEFYSGGCPRTSPESHGAHSQLSSEGHCRGSWQSLSASIVTHCISVTSRSGGVPRKLKNCSTNIIKRRPLVPGGYMAMRLLLASTLLFAGHFSWCQAQPSTPSLPEAARNLSTGVLDLGIRSRRVSASHRRSCTWASEADKAVPPTPLSARIDQRRHAARPLFDQWSKNVIPSVLPSFRTRYFRLWALSENL